MEDIYAKSRPFSDYHNVPYVVFSLATSGERELTSDNLAKVAESKGKLFKSVEEWQLEYRHTECDGAVKQHPLKVCRLNKIADKVNSDPSNVRLFKQAWNEITRLVYGLERALPYPESENNPDLLQL
jgi:hypothetical protein